MCAPLTAGARKAADSRASVGALLQPATGWTLWVKNTHVTGGRYVASRQVNAATSVDEFISRWVASEKLDVSPSHVSLRLVPHTGEDEPTAAQDAAATTLNPRKTLAAAGVADGSWLVAVFAAAAGA